VIVEHEDRVTPWSSFPHHGNARVRIWIRRTPFGFFQRHEWEREDGSIWFENWIVHPGRRFPERAAPADHPPTGLDLAVQALEAIEAGHNDARGLARETLAAIKDALSR